MRISRFRYTFAQLGHKAEKDLARSMLLDPSDLPGGEWTIRGDMTWRTGRFGKPSPILHAASKAGKFTALRTYQQEVPSERWLMAKVVPASSESDASAIAPRLWSLSFPNPDAKVKVEGEPTVQDVAIDGLSNSLVCEQLSRGWPTESTVTASRYVAGNVGSVAILVECSGTRDDWPWEEVASVAAKQAERCSQSLKNRASRSASS